MNRRTLKIIVLSMLVIMSTAAVLMFALPAQQCRGTRGCEDLVEACAFPEEYVNSDRTGSWCVNLECKTWFRVRCIDLEERDNGTEEEDCYYFRSAYCWSMIYAHECKGSVMY